LNTRNFGLHSLRSGGASSASNPGVCEGLLQKHGRWQSETSKIYTLEKVTKLDEVCL
jgi:hypothetical protein